LFAIKDHHNAMQAEI